MVKNSRFKVLCNMFRFWR